MEVAIAYTNFEAVSSWLTDKDPGPHTICSDFEGCYNMVEKVLKIMV